MVKKGIVFLVYGAACTTVFIYKTSILLWLADGKGGQLPWVMSVAVLLALVPIVPYGIVAGFIGAAYGLVWGSLINIACSTAAAALTFLTVRGFLQNRERPLLKAPTERMARFIMALERNAFLAVFIARLLPFVPAFAVNLSAAMIRMSFGNFILATVIGKIPVMFVFAVLGSQLFSSTSDVLWTLVIYGGFLAIVYGCFRWWNYSIVSFRKRDSIDE